MQSFVSTEMTKRRNDRQDFLKQIDSLNNQIHGGQPTVGFGKIGELPVPSGTLVLGDPQSAIFCFNVLIGRIASGKVTFSAEMAEYPDGALMPRSLFLEFEPGRTSNVKRVIGQIGVDSGCIVVADESDVEQFWTDTGPDRVGKILTARDRRAATLIRKRFGLKLRYRDPIVAEVVGPVSEELEQEILSFLETIPEFADYPWMHFRVDTNNTFERTCNVNGPGAFLPIGNQSAPEMLVCRTGRGDGVYNVTCEYAGRRPCRASIVFVDDSPLARSP